MSDGEGRQGGCEGNCASAPLGELWVSHQTPGGWAIDHQVEEVEITPELAAQWLGVPPGVFSGGNGG
jgi:hypothetical protein